MFDSRCPTKRRAPGAVQIRHLKFGHQRSHAALDKAHATCSSCHDLPSHRHSRSEGTPKGNVTARTCAGMARMSDVSRPSRRYAGTLGSASTTVAHSADTSLPADTQAGTTAARAVAATERECWSSWMDAVWLSSVITCVREAARSMAVSSGAQLRRTVVSWKSPAWMRMGENFRLDQSAETAGLGQSA